MNGWMDGSRVEIKRLIDFELVSMVWMVVVRDITYTVYAAPYSTAAYFTYSPLLTIQYNHQVPPSQDPTRPSHSSANCAMHH